MEDKNENNLPKKIEQSRDVLWEEIQRFSSKKYYWAALLIFVGLLGLVVPVIPGLLLIAFAVALLKPGLMAKLRRKAKKWFGKS